MSIRALSLAAVFALGGCAASVPPAQVTRFHLDGDVARGPVAPAAGATTLEHDVYEAAVFRELSGLGFLSGETGASRYLIATEVTRDVRPRAPRGSPISIGIGGGTGGYRSGVGGGVSFGIGGDRSRETVVTRLSVQIRERATGGVVWEGRAETEAPDRAPAAQPGLAADKLARALFRGFPGESGRTISVP